MDTVEKDYTNYKMTTNNETALSPVQPPPVEAPRQTAAQAKVDAVANLTFRAYERASTLTLTKEESDALQAPFADSDFRKGAAGKADLIYIQHSALRDRLNRVLGIGQWSIIPRARWAEDGRTSKGDPVTTIYVEAMLVVRGAYVSEAIGDMSYFPASAAQNYGDAVEGAKTAALRRTCKEMGVGLQAWDKAWIDGWWERNGQPRQTQSAPPPPPAVKPAVSPPAPKPTPVPAPEPEGLVVNPHPNQPSDSDMGACLIHFTKHKGKSLKDMTPQTLHWFAEVWEPKPYNGSINHKDTHLKEAAVRYLKHYRSQQQPSDNEITP